MVSLSVVALALTSLLASVPGATAAQRLPATSTNSNRRHARRVLKKNDNISEKIKEEKSKGAKAPKLTVTAEIEEGEGAGFDLDLDVIEATPSIDEYTLFELEDTGGKPQKPKTLSQVLEGASLADILVTDPSSANADGSFAVLAVNLDSDEMHGFVEKAGSKPYKLSQKKGSKGGKTMADEETDPAAVSFDHWFLVFNYPYIAMIQKSKIEFKLFLTFSNYLHQLCFIFSHLAADPRALGLRRVRDI